jgi:hypothetical protein
MDKFSKVDGCEKLVHQVNPPPPKVRTTKKKKKELENFKFWNTTFTFLQVSHKAMKRLEVKFSCKIVCMGLPKNFHEHFFSFKIHLHVDES